MQNQLVDIVTRAPINIGDEVYAIGVAGKLVGAEQYGGVRVRFGDATNYAETVYAPCVINAEWVKVPEKQYQVITSDLHELPLCIINANGVEELFGYLEQWSFEATLTKAEREMVKSKLAAAKPPSDALLGMCVTEQFYLCGMTMHICFGE